MTEQELVNCSKCKEDSYVWNDCKKCQVKICLECWGKAEEKWKEDQTDKILCPSCGK